MRYTIIHKTDSLRRIQQILNSSRYIKFEKGIYKITKQLIIPKNTTIDLNNSILRRCGNIQSIFINAVSKNSMVYNADGNITIYNGVMEGMGGYQYDNTLSFFHSHDISLKRITFLDCCGSHSIELNACSNVFIQNCKFLGYNSNPNATFREQIQIDFAGYSEFVLSGSYKTSKCYDGTHCNNITIKDCTFDKSSSRPGCNAAIGNHAACSNGKRHINIKICNNKIRGYGIDSNQCGINLTSIENTIIENNEIEGFGRAIRIFVPAYFYALNGQKKTIVQPNTGTCRNTYISKNKIGINVGKLKSSGIYSYSKTNSRHQKIIVNTNIFTGNKFTRDAVNLSNADCTIIQNNKSNRTLQYRSPNQDAVIRNNS